MLMVPSYAGEMLYNSFSSNTFECQESISYFYASGLKLYEAVSDIIPVTDRKKSYITCHPWMFFQKSPEGKITPITLEFQKNHHKNLLL